MDKIENRLLQTKIDVKYTESNEILFEIPKMYTVSVITIDKAKFDSSMIDERFVLLERKKES